MSERISELNKIKEKLEKYVKSPKGQEAILRAVENAEETTTKILEVSKVDPSKLKEPITL